jgi:hypothetical protein
MIHPASQVTAMAGRPRRHQRMVGSQKTTGRVPDVHWLALVGHPRWAGWLEDDQLHVWGVSFISPFRGLGKGQRNLYGTVGRTWRASRPFWGLSWTIPFKKSGMAVMVTNPCCLMVVFTTSSGWPQTCHSLPCGTKRASISRFPLSGGFPSHHNGLKNGFQYSHGHLLIHYHTFMTWMICGVPSGKRLHNYGNIHHFSWENSL